MSCECLPWRQFPLRGMSDPIYGGKKERKIVLSAEFGHRMLKVDSLLVFVKSVFVYLDKFIQGMHLWRYVGICIFFLFFIFFYFKLLQFILL